MQWLQLAQCASASKLQACVKENACAKAPLTPSLTPPPATSPTPTPAPPPATSTATSTSPSISPFPSTSTSISKKPASPESVQIVNSLIAKYAKEEPLVKELQVLHKRLAQLEAENAVRGQVTAPSPSVVQGQGEGKAAVQGQCCQGQGATGDATAKLEFLRRCECCRIFGMACDGFPKCNCCKQQGMPCVYRVTDLSVGPKTLAQSMHITADTTGALLQVFWPPSQDRSPHLQLQPQFQLQPPSETQPQLKPPLDLKTALGLKPQLDLKPELQLKNPLQLKPLELKLKPQPQLQPQAQSQGQPVVTYAKRNGCCNTCVAMKVACEQEPCKMCKTLNVACVFDPAPKKPVCAEKDTRGSPAASALTSKLKKSCERCVASKVKCDGYPVCSRCRKKGWECVFTARRKRSSRPRPLSGTEVLAEAALARFKKAKCCSLFSSICAKEEKKS